MKERYLVTFLIDNKKQYLHDDLKLTNRLFIFKNFELACKCAAEYSEILKNEILTKTNISESYFKIYNNLYDNKNVVYMQHNKNGAVIYEFEYNIKSVINNKKIYIVINNN